MSIWDWGRSRIFQNNANDLIKPTSVKQSGPDRQDVEFSLANIEINFLSVQNNWQSLNPYLQFEKSIIQLYQFCSFIG